MPNGLKPPPDPMKVVDTAVGLVLCVPKFPAVIIQRVGSAVGTMGSEMSTAASPAAVDPASLVGGAVNYVLAVPKGVLGVVRGVFDGAVGTFEEARGRIDRLVR